MAKSRSGETIEDVRRRQKRNEIVWKCVAVVATIVITFAILSVVG